MADTVLSDGREITFDLYKMTIKDYAAGKGSAGRNSQRRAAAGISIRRAGIAAVAQRDLGDAATNRFAAGAARNSSAEAANGAACSAKRQLINNA